MPYESIPIDFIVKLGKSAIDQDNIGLANGVWYILEKWKLHTRNSNSNETTPEKKSEDVLGCNIIYTSEEETEND